MPTLYNPARRWELTDVGAMQWYAMQALINQHQAAINALVSRVAMLEHQLNTQKAANATR